MTLDANIVIIVIMKRFILMFVAVMFMANTFAISAWATPCMNMDTVSSTQEIKALPEMPCHEDMDKEQQTPLKHCDGVCLCLHASISQTPVLNSQANLDILFIRSERLFAENERVASFATAPPSPPPKYNS